MGRSAKYNLFPVHKQLFRVQIKRYHFNITGIWCERHSQRRQNTELYPSGYTHLLCQRNQATRQDSDAEINRDMHFE